MAESKTFKVGLFIGSARVVRIAPQVADFVLDTIKAAGPEASSNTTIDVIDIADQKLPFFDEPGIPQMITSAEGYENEHTRVWSRRISACDAFIFVSAQRNWGYPAELKNALDYLFNEWKSKPAMIVTYGGHGGTRAAEQLKTVLEGMKVDVIEKMVAMSFPSPDFRVKSFKGEDVGLDASNDASPWAEHRSEIVAVWEDLVKRMTAGQA